MQYHNILPKACNSFTLVLPNPKIVVFNMFLIYALLEKLNKNSAGHFSNICIIFHSWLFVFTNQPKNWLKFYILPVRNI